MKTNYQNRWNMVVRVAACVIIIAAIAGVEYQLCKAWNRQVDYQTLRQGNPDQVWYPNANVDYFVSAATR